MQPMKKKMAVTAALVVLKALVPVAQKIMHDARTSETPTETATNE